MGIFDFLKRDSNKGSKFSMPFFGELELNNLKDYYEVEVENNNRIIQVDLNFESETVSNKIFNKTSRLIQELGPFIESVTEYLKENRSNEEAVDEYLEHHLNELEETEISNLLKNSNNSLSKKDQLFELLKLKRIGIYPESEDEYVVCDFMINDDLSDYLLVVKLDKNEDIDEVTIES
jgi:hypothetical protein